MIASIENMRMFYKEGEPLVAYSPGTGEEYSANPSDYFYTPPQWVMKDQDGEPMILGRFTQTFLPVEVLSEGATLWNGTDSR